jgi:hypothetical protein
MNHTGKTGPRQSMHESAIGRIRWIGPLVLLIASVAPAPAAGAGGVPLCTLIPFALPDTGTTYVLGSATPDTVFAGPGPVEPSGGPGHTGSGRRAKIHEWSVR